jgi:hypothetical protein
MVTMHDPVPEQPPDQPANTDDVSAVAVIVTTVPSA